MVLKKTVESPLDSKKIPPVNSQRNQSWIFIGRTDAKAETSILWPPDVKNWLIWKDPDAGKDLRQKEKQTTEDEMVGWHHWLNGHEFEWTLGVGDGQGSLVCYSPWGHKESDMIEWLNWTDNHKVWYSEVRYISLTINTSLCCYLIFIIILIALEEANMWLYQNLCKKTPKLRLITVFLFFLARVILLMLTSSHRFLLHYFSMIMKMVHPVCCHIASPESCY